VDELKPRLRVPATAKRGDIVEIRTLVSHPMETGYRRDTAGKALPRDTLTALSCTYGDEEVFRAELHPAIAANPYIAFTLRADRSGPVNVAWEKDSVVVAEASAPLEVVE
jgi:sulfur-oxidizing protein SoxZ